MVICFLHWLVRRLARGHQVPGESGVIAGTADVSPGPAPAACSAASALSRRRARWLPVMDQRLSSPESRPVPTSLCPIRDRRDSRTPAAGTEGLPTPQRGKRSASTRQARCQATSFTAVKGGVLRNSGILYLPADTVLAADHQAKEDGRDGAQWPRRRVAHGKRPRGLPPGRATVPRCRGRPGGDPPHGWSRGAGGLPRACRRSRGGMRARGAVGPRYRRPERRFP